ncbi:probable WRKY transcription factor 51 [Cornus florida]|uniref:probable WRKY transcription factor 51 n=1 Tax=Cornus florida TaxID=4283 RepID=UPI00289664A3|nr:probable WRKY transcription factor 51 [Cornus florida]
MSGPSTLLATNLPQAVQNPNFTYSTMEAYDHDHYYHYQKFEPFDYHVPFLDPKEDQTVTFTASRPTSAVTQEMITSTESSVNSICGMPRTNNHMQVKSGKGLKRSVKNMDKGLRIAFRTKSEVEVMDDGFKWRKYGKKRVKDSPNLRNYYKCSNQACKVKKRVERDREDSSYVITSYEGVHNHESPCVVYYNYEVPISEWTLQHSHTSS